MEETYKSVRRSHSWLMGICSAVLLFSIPTCLGSDLERTSALLSRYQESLDDLITDAVRQRDDALSEQLFELLVTHGIEVGPHDDWSHLADFHEKASLLEAPLATHQEALTSTAVELEQFQPSELATPLKSLAISMAGRRIHFRLDHLSWLPCSEHLDSRTCTMLIRFGTSNSDVDDSTLRSHVQSRLKHAATLIGGADVTLNLIGTSNVIEMVVHGMGPVIRSIPVLQLDSSSTRSILSELMNAGPWNAIGSYSAVDALAETERLKELPSRELKAFGVSISSDHAFLVGSSLILVVAVLFLAHLIHLQQRQQQLLLPRREWRLSSNEPHGQSAPQTKQGLTPTWPWIGLFRGRLGTPVAYFSIIAVPIISAMALFVAVGFKDEWGLVAMLLVVALEFWTARTLYNVRRDSHERKA